MSTRTGDWIQTYTGKQFWPLSPLPEDIVIEDIAHALSMQCRFGGHVRTFYSVAQHSVHVSLLVEPQYALWGLLHDAAEAYLVDLPRPIKKFSEMGLLYQEIEAALMTVICRRFGLQEQEPYAVKKADNTMLVTEMRDLMAEPPKAWDCGEVHPLHERLLTMSQEAAEVAFLRRFKGLVG
jgi:uncharacterized protein